MSSRSRSESSWNYSCLFSLFKNFMIMQQHVCFLLREGRNCEMNEVNLSCNCVFVCVCRVHGSSWQLQSLLVRCSSSLKRWRWTQRRIPPIWWPNCELFTMKHRSIPNAKTSSGELHNTKNVSLTDPFPYWRNCLTRWVN